MKRILGERDAPATIRRNQGRRCCILVGMEDPFDFQLLRIRQPGKLLPDRANYEIFNGDRKLLATATETEGHTRLKLLGKSMPDTRAVAVTTAAGEPLGFLIQHSSEWITEFQGPGGELIGRIRTGDTRRNYTLLGDEDQVVAKVTGDLALKHFSVAVAKGAAFARVRKTFAGLTKEMLTPSDHYTVEFTGPVSQPARTLTVMMPIVLDLTLYGPT
jgi:hypothetical protein